MNTFEQHKILGVPTPKDFGIGHCSECNAPATEDCKHH
mgnify:CR=1 FL=1|jgi:hypothetical protein|tara:strand:+ start:102 stop:215 length:114 start_codon:yes stop_codon:yes gene_type:complete